jgi:hypothetical protein
MKHPIGRTSNGVEVYVNLINSSAAKNIAQQPKLLGLVAEALPKITLKGTNVSVEHDVGRPVGYSFVVETNSADAVFYAQIYRKNTFTRFIKNGTPLSTKHITLVFNYNEVEEAYELLDTWLGRINPPRPGEATETPESKPYWENHAIILGNQPLQLRSVTKTCPY